MVNETEIKKIQFFCQDIKENHDFADKDVVSTIYVTEVCVGMKCVAGMSESKIVIKRWKEVDVNSEN